MGGRKVKVSPRFARQAWPFLFSRRVPGALDMCHWAADQGAVLHPALRLNRGDRKLGNFVTTTKPLRAGTAVMSVPLDAVVTSAVEDRSAAESAMEEVMHVFARGLNDAWSPFHQYLSFLHDSHNDEEAAVAEEEHLQAAVGDLDKILMGNAVDIRGVDNAPFLQRKDFSLPRMRVKWGKLHDLLREVQQGVPHFAANAVPWAASMVISRAIEDIDSNMCIVPLVDLCNHSFSPTTHYYVSDPDAQRKGERWKGVYGWRERRPYFHLLTISDVPAGGPITYLYSDSDPRTTEGGEFWRFHWGFAPRGAPKKGCLKSDVVSRVAAVSHSDKKKPRRNYSPKGGPSKPKLSRRRPAYAHQQ